MKQLTILFLPVLTLISCNSAKPEPPVVVNNESALIIGDPLDCGIDSIALFPVGCSYSPLIIEGESEPTNNAVGSTNYSSTLKVSDLAFSENSVASEYKFDRNAQTEYYNENEEDFDIRNLLFYNLFTGESYPLIKDSIHILSFALHKEFEKPLIFYRVVRSDYNKDKKYNGSDPVMLYISNLDGTNFQQITPENEYFVDYTLYEKTNSILIKTSIDSNKDLKFLKDDETNFRKMNLSTPAFAENIFKETLKDDLRGFN